MKRMGAWRGTVWILLLAFFLSFGCRSVPDSVNSQSASVPATAVTTPLPTPAPTATPLPTPVPTATPAPTPELTGRALRAYLLQQEERAYFEAKGLSQDEIDRRLEALRIDPDKPLVALTFDDGPNVYTPGILDVLEQYNARATFFVVGYSIENHEDSVERAISINCEIGNHSYDHADYSRQDIASFLKSFGDTDAILWEQFGYQMRVCRAPYGAVGDAVHTGAAEMGYAIIGWSRSSFDCNSISSYDVYINCLSASEDGGIVLLHDLQPRTSAAAKWFIPALIDKGYQLVTVSELLYLCGVDAEAGVCYVGAREGDVPQYGQQNLP